MKRVFAILAAFSTTVILTGAVTGCSSNHSDEAATLKNQAPHPAFENGAQGGPAWKLRYLSQCNAENAENCIGTYGFTINALGDYQVGPGPSGEILKGTLTRAELESIEKTLAEVLSGVHVEVENDVTCVDRGSHDASSPHEEILYNRRGYERELVRTTRSDFCFQSGTVSAYNQLHETVRQVTKKYYPLPFPGKCADAAIDVASLYTTIQGCRTDLDCAYIDNAYSPIPPGELQFVYTDDCSMIPPLSVGNRGLVKDSYERLQMARAYARDICGAQLYRPQCPTVSGFSAERSAPVCVAGTCRINPAIGNF